jgi:hypothetical protein
MNEPMRLYRVEIHWQSGPTLTAQPSIIDKWTFAGNLKTRHVRAMLGEHATDTLAWNVRTQLTQVVAKLIEFESNTFDPLEDAEKSRSISGLESFGVLINSQQVIVGEGIERVAMTMDFTLKLGKTSPVVRMTIERQADAVLAAD